MQINKLILLVFFFSLSIKPVYRQIDLAIFKKIENKLICLEITDLTKINNKVDDNDDDWDDCEIKLAEKPCSQLEGVSVSTPNFDNLLLLHPNSRFFAKIDSKKFIFYQLTSNADASKIMALHPNTIINWYYKMYEPPVKAEEREKDFFDNCIIM